MKVQLKDTDKEENFYPITGAECVYFQDGSTLSERWATVKHDLIGDIESVLNAIIVGA